jgi:TonB-linked SusC/RagA family outer membrane protein
MNNHIKLLWALLLFNTLFSSSLLSQDKLIVTVKDGNDATIANASVTIGEQVETLSTNENGEFVLEGAVTDLILIEADGFESKLTDFSSVVASNNLIILTDKKVHLPFASLPKRHLTAAVTNIDVPRILKYDQHKSVGQALNGRVSGMLGAFDIRGIGGFPLIVVDGVPRSAADLNMQQIDQITVLKDLSSAMMYGSQANNGVILISTKRGKPLKKEIKFTMERGLKRAISYPDFLEAADYMELYNEARENDGLLPLYSTTDISNTRSGEDPVRYPDEDYYNDNYLNDYNSFTHVVGEASGGNEIANYYLNLGWDQENSFLKLGEGDNEVNNRLNLQGNIGYKINDFIAFRFDGSILFDFYNGPRYSNNDFWKLSSTLLPNYAPLLIPSDLVEDEDLLAGAYLYDNKYLFGGTSEYQTNIYGELTRNGLSSYSGRFLNLNPGLDFNLDFITPGLSANVNVYLNMFNWFTTELANSYKIYQIEYQPIGTVISPIGQDVRQDNMSVDNVYFDRRNVIYGNLNYKRVFNNDHSINSTALAYSDSYSLENQDQPIKNLHFGLRGNYAYKNRYFAELTGTFAVSGKLLGGNHPTAFSPGIGLGWILTEESFMMDNQWMDYLKIRANWANLNTDRNMGYFYYEDRYSRGGTFNFGHGSYSNNESLITNGNPDLGWEKVANTNIGIESMFMDYKLGVDLTYFYIKSYDLISRMTNSLPAYFAGNSYQNYESNQVQGIETNVNYNINFGELRLRIAGNLTYSVPKELIVDEIDYEEEYRKRTGKETDAIFGYVAMGLFQDQDDINKHAEQTFGVVNPGDIKYMDLNDDGIINEKDQQVIGNFRPRLGYGLNLTLEYKKFGFFALVHGTGGENRFFNNSYYWIYGERKYSEVVRNRWTPETAATATYPRLTTGGGSNNFRKSTYWLENNSRLNLQTVQLYYTLPEFNLLGTQEARIYLRAYNVFQISKTKEKNELNIGSAPQTRDFSIGLTATF